VSAEVKKGLKIHHGVYDKLKINSDLTFHAVPTKKKTIIPRYDPITSNLLKLMFALSTEVNDTATTKKFNI
jgi:hypothetical protein